MKMVFKICSIFILGLISVASMFYGVQQGQEFASGLAWKMFTYKNHSIYFFVFATIFVHSLYIVSGYSIVNKIPINKQSIIGLVWLITYLTFTYTTFITMHTFTDIILIDELGFLEKSILFSFNLIFVTGIGFKVYFALNTYFTYDFSNYLSGYLKA